MIHALIHMPASDTTYVLAPEESPAWGELLLTWWWNGRPFATITPSRPPDVRWKRKLWTEEDLAHPIFGARSMMYIAPSRAAQSGEGIDDVDFARQGLPDTDAGDDAEWGL